MERLASHGFIDETDHALVYLTNSEVWTLTRDEIFCVDHIVVMERLHGALHPDVPEILHTLWL